MYVTESQPSIVFESDSVSHFQPLAAAKLMLFKRINLFVKTTMLSTPCRCKYISIQSVCTVNGNNGNGKNGNGKLGNGKLGNGKKGNR